MIAGIPLVRIMSILTGLLFLAASFYSWWIYNRVTTLANRTEVLEKTLASTTALLIQTMTLSQEKINLEHQLGDLSGTVTTLQKLSQTDPQLLAKYSKIYFLNEHYIPERLVQIDQDFVYSETRPEQILAQVEPYLQDLLEEAKNDDIALYVKSAYRSFDEQQALKGDYTVTYGAGTANSFSADQGYSEHQLGTAVDFITTGTGGQLAGFDQKPAYEWLQDNAYKYGFILSYPKNNGYYIFEPWHWRFVGVRLATDLHNEHKNFYDLDQRTIDTYLASIFDR